MASLSVRNVVKNFGDIAVLRNVSVDVEDGEFLAILGPSGCGKSTLLRVIAGLEGVNSGSVALDGRDVTRLPPKARNVAMVFQSYALYPHMTVARNISVPLEMRRLSALRRLPVVGALLPGTRALRREIAAEVARVAESLGLSALLDRRPAQLSGGQRQRVALARAMVRNPAAFLMDEPLSNLDARLRTEARDEILSLQRRLDATVIYVTHDQAEAMAMARRIAVMQAGRLLQVAPPQALYDDPASLEVARFIGSPPINALPATLDAKGMVVVAGRRLPLAAPHANRTVTLGVRPEAFELCPEGAGLPARIRRIERLGAEAILHAVLPDSADPILVRLAPAQAEGLGEERPIGLTPRHALLFGADGARLPGAAVPREAVHG